MKYENLWESLKIHAGGDDKLWTQFAPPYITIQTFAMHIDSQNYHIGNELLTAFTDEQGFLNASAKF